MTANAPAVTSPLSPSDVFGLMQASTLSFDYDNTNVTSLVDLNTEFYFLSSAFNGRAFITNITINNTSTLYSGTIGRVYIQNLQLTGNLTITNSLPFSLFDLTVDGNISIQSVSDLEISKCTVIGQITYPATLSSLLVHGQYVDFSYRLLLNKVLYPNLTNLFYFNERDGLGEVSDIPSGFTGFGTFNIVQTASSTLLTVFASSTPPINIMQQFPNLRKLMIIETPAQINSLAIIGNSTNSFKELTIIGGINLQSVDVSNCIIYLTSLRITHCPQLLTLILTNGNIPVSLSSLRVEYCSILYFVGYAQLNNLQEVKIDNQTAVNIKGSRVASGQRVLDTIKFVNNTNIVLNAITYFIMNNVSSLAMLITTTFTYSVNSGAPPIVINNTSVNPFIPGSPSQLSKIEITESVYNLRYIINISNNTLLSSTPQIVTSASMNNMPVSDEKGNSLNTIIPILRIGGLVLLLLIAMILIIYFVVTKRRREKKSARY